jgi:hypothetical protein
VASHIGLNSNPTAIEKEIADAEKAAREEAKKRQKTGNGGKKPIDDTPAPAATKPEEKPQQTASLFESHSGVSGQSIEVSHAVGQTE